MNGIRKRFHLAFLLAWSAFQTGGARAQDFVRDATPDRLVVTAEESAPAAQIRPERGTRSYELGPETIDLQGRGPDSGFNEILLHAPGVSRETSGQFHLRGEDYGLQYRLNGVQLPEGIASSLGQQFDSRLLRSVTVSSGALPAQYGLRNAGVVELQTKSGADLAGQEAVIYGGSHGMIRPSFSSGGTDGKTDYFVTASYLQDDLGTDNVTASRTAIHDQTRQSQAFALLTRELAPGQKLSLIFSGVRASFQIPDAPGLQPGFADGGTTAFDSARLDRNQDEQNYYGIVAYRFESPGFSLQAAEINSYSSTHYRPDRMGDLLFTGAASDAERSLLGTSGQLDAAWNLGESHTLRTGAILLSQGEHTASTNTVLPADPETGEILSTTPETIDFRAGRRDYLYGVYVQDQWHAWRRLTLNYGVRFDGSNGVVHEQAFSPRVNAVYQVTPTATVHAGYARVFTPPLLEYVRPADFARLVGTTDAPARLTDDPPRAERSHGFDLGASWEVRPGFMFGVDGYYKSVRNMPDEEQLGASLIFSPFTYRRGYKEGVEFTAEYRWGVWQVYGSLAVAETKGRGINTSQGLFDAEELAYIKTHDIHTDYDQRLTASGGAAYRWKGLALHTDLLFGSGFFGGFANSQALPSHYTLNLGAAYTFVWSARASLSLRFDVINATDQSYLLHDAGIGATVDQYSERRGFFGGMTYRFGGS